MINKMNDFELNNVVGGTVKEFNEILDAYKSKGKFAQENNIRTVFTPIVARTEKALKEDFNIDANISVGWGGTDFRSVKNTYFINGKSISHEEVLNMIKAA